MLKQGQQTRQQIVEYGCIAQLVEQPAFNRLVVGSSPSAPTKYTKGNLMVKKVGDYKVPFDADGNQLDYHYYSTHSLVDNFVFEDTLTYKDFQRGRSSAQFSFTRSNGKSVIVFMKDMDIFIPRIVNGQITGTFTFVKRGQNYGVTILE